MEVEGCEKLPLPEVEVMGTLQIIELIYTLIFFWNMHSNPGVIIFCGSDPEGIEN
jgi:hypothetical protein